MSSNYRIGFQSAAAAAGAAYAAFRAPTRTCRIIEVGLACNAATASNISMLRNTAAGYTATTTSSAGQAENPMAAAGTGVVDSGWSTAPTITAASRMMRYTLPATIGAGLIWTFPDGIFVRNATATDYLVFWNEGASAGSALNGYVVWAE